MTLIKTLVSAFKGNKEPIHVQIHRDFFTEGERLLKEAKDIALDSPGEKGARLSNLGFTSSMEASMLSEWEKKHRLTEKEAQVVLKYQQLHPLYKFITDKGVERICSKYGLLPVKAKYYTGAIPDNNLEEIENFMRYTEAKNINTHTASVQIPRIYGIPHHMNFIISDENYELFRKRLANQSYRNSREHIHERFSLSFVDKIEFGQIEEERPWLSKEISYVGRQKIFYICCPPKDVHPDFFDNRKKHISLRKKLEDPVVLFPVGDGYLIVSAWGPEASDKEVINPKNN